MINVRSHFPFFAANSDLIFFDNASTSQKPQQVIDTISSYLSTQCANAGRGSYTLANTTTRKVEKVREKVKEFINGHSSEEVIFTSGATESLSIVTYAWGLYNLKNDDEILMSFDDHQANVLPWIQLRDTLALFGIKIKLVPYKLSPTGDADEEDIIAKANKHTRLIAVTHIHNVYGTKADVEILRKRIPKRILISLDASQSIGHTKVDVQALGVDFMSFSGHKMFASPGSGVLWIHQRIHAEIHPVFTGGGISQSDTISRKSLSYKSLPSLMESGSLNLVGIVSLGSAIDYINSITIEAVEERLLILSQYLLAKLREIEAIEFLPGIAFCKCAVGYGIISFTLAGVASSDVGFALNDKNICVRTGNHCVNSDTVSDSIRVSLHIYNTPEEIDQLILVLKEILR